MHNSYYKGCVMRKIYVKKFCDVNVSQFFRVSAAAKIVLTRKITENARMPTKQKE